MRIPVLALVFWQSRPPILIVEWMHWSIIRLPSSIGLREDGVGHPSHHHHHRQLLYSTFNTTLPLTLELANSVLPKCWTLNEHQCTTFQCLPLIEVGQSGSKVTTTTTTTTNSDHTNQLYNLQWYIWSTPSRLPEIHTRRHNPSSNWQPITLCNYPLLLLLFWLATFLQSSTKRVSSYVHYVRAWVWSDNSYQLR